MPRRADEAQGRLELSFPDGSAQPEPVAAAPAHDGMQPLAKPASAEAGGRTTPRRRRGAASRPVRGEQDVALPPYRGDWRIDGRTRLAGMSGVARARAALAAVGDDGELGDRKVDAA